VKERVDWHWDVKEKFRGDEKGRKKNATSQRNIVAPIIRKDS
jgi:hypothetical protein